VKAGKKVSFDFEDWYSRDYLVPTRPAKLLASLERFAIRHGEFCTAASGSMALALAKIYGETKEITVIYNSFPKSESSGKDLKPFTRQPRERMSMLWFSRTIGAGRGIEHFIEGIRYSNVQVDLHLLGTLAKGYESVLDSAFPHEKGHRLIYHDFIPHNQLPLFIRQFKVGLALEEDINDNKRLTIANKIMQYLQEGLLVIASSNEGHREVAEYFSSSVKLVDLYDPVGLANVLECLPDALDDHEEIFNRYFSWEAQEEKLRRTITKIYGH
jgi:hypothetical protein